MKKNLGFTLIEILIVVGMISLFSSAFFYNSTEAKQKADDAHMKTEARQVKNAIELYKLDNEGQVPSSSGTKGTMAPETSNGYKEAMQKLVADGYLSEIPASPDGKSYAYMTNDLVPPTEAVFAASLNFNEKSKNFNQCEIVGDVQVSFMTKDSFFAGRRSARDGTSPGLEDSVCPVIPPICSSSDSVSVATNLAVQTYISDNGTVPRKDGSSGGVAILETDSDFDDYLQPLVIGGYISEIPSSATGDGYYYYACGDNQSAGFKIDARSQYCSDLADGFDPAAQDDEEGDIPVCSGEIDSDYCMCI